LESIDADDVYKKENENITSVKYKETTNNENTTITTNSNTVNGITTTHTDTTT